MSTIDAIRARLTDYGFEWGPATVERMCHDAGKGWVLLNIKTARHPNGIQIYVTRTGHVSINGKRFAP